MPRRFKTPGPGSYDVPAWMKMGEGVQRSPTAAFKSSSSRIASKSHGADGGDPGRYDTTAAGPKASLSARSHQTFNRSSSSWSLSPARGHASPHSQRGGPGEHDYSNLYEMGRMATSVTSSFKSSVPLGAHVRRIDTPGPGVYDPDVGRGAVQSPSSMSRDGHSMFAGSTKQHKDLGIKGGTGAQVGPGTYSPNGSLQDAARSAVNPRLPGFASSTPRLVGVGSERARSPAPGDYDDFAGRTLSASSQRTFNTAANREGGYRFGSTSARSMNAASRDAGDPGAYVGPFAGAGVHKGNAEPLAAKSSRSFNREATTGRGSFDSRSARASSKSLDSASQRGGPGEHDYSNLYEMGRMATSVTSSFKSSVPLGAHVRRIDTPGPGVYDPDVGRGAVQSPSSMSRDGHSMFAGSTKQHKDLGIKGGTGAQVGPGTYDMTRHTILDKMVAKRNERLPGFASSAPRGIDDYEYDA